MTEPAKSYGPYGITSMKVQTMTQSTDEQKDQAMREAIAKVMGWKSMNHERGDGMEVVLWAQPDSQASFWSNPQPPDYLNDANAALLLVEHMRKEWWSTEWIDATTGECFAFSKNGDEHYAIAPTFPLAICRAFIAANNIQIP